MPKAAMYEYDTPESGENEIGTAGQIPAMQAETVSHRVRQASDKELGIRVRSVNATHPFAARGG
jgi:hypothetical protein